MSKEKSEKQLEASRLRDSIVRLSITQVPIHYVRKNIYGEEKDVVDVYDMCIVNGEKYIRKGCIGTPHCSFIGKMERMGDIKESDYLHAHNSGTSGAQGTKIFTFLRTEPLLRLHDELIEYVRRCSYSEYQLAEANRMFDAINCTSVVIGENMIDESRLSESEAAYARRKELIREAKEERREALRIEEEMRREKEGNETLKELVSKIEAMGWEVTLRRKH